MLGNKPPNDASKHRWKIAVAVFSGILSLACVRLKSLYFLFKFMVTIFGVITEKKKSRKHCDLVTQAQTHLLKREDGL